MKKLIVLLALIFLVSGCTTIESNDNLEKVVNEVLSYDIDLHNQNFAGYQYYLPRGVLIFDKYDYNTILMFDNRKMYLYVDVISYYHKIKEEYTVKDNIYFSKVLQHGDKNGYINVYKKDKEYYIDIAYNYGKIETYATQENLNTVVINCLYILNSLDYNDVVIDSLIGENKIEYQEERFDLFRSEGSEENYLTDLDDVENDEENRGNLFDDDDVIVIEEDDDLIN